MQGTVIVHSGTKGMKWHHRLYQNYDGTLTPLGKARYRKDKDRLNSDAALREYLDDKKNFDRKYSVPRNMTDDELKNDAAREALIQKYEKNHPKQPTGLEVASDSMGKIQSGLGQSRSGAKAIADMIDSSRNKKNRQDLSGMSNKELQERVNRMNLERSYRSMTEQQHAGREAVDRAFDIGMGTVSIASAALSIAVALKTLRG